MALDVNNKTFVIYVVIWEWEKMLVYSKKQAQVKALLFDKALTEVLVEHFDYSDVFSAEYIAELPKNIRLNEYAIKLEEDKQLFFGPMYNLEPIKLEILKTYIKTNLANNFIWPFKSPAKAFILFNKKPNKSFRLYIDYWSLNNIIMKNQYLLTLIGKLLN